MPNPPGLDAALIGIPIGLLTLAILWVNEFPDAPSDLATGKKHRVATLGTRQARRGYAVLCLGPFPARGARGATGTPGPCARPAAGGRVPG